MISPLVIDLIDDLVAELIPSEQITDETYLFEDGTDFDFEDGTQFDFNL